MWFSPVLTLCFLPVLAMPALAGVTDGALEDAVSLIESGRMVMSPGEVAGVVVARAAAGEPTGGAASSSGESDADSLAKKLSNPVADLISIPFQLNYDEGYGPRDIGWWTLKVQPVIPIGLTEDWNVIARVITPFLWRPAPTVDLDYESGLGDVNPSFFLSPKEPMAGWIWGVGPAFLLPTATNADLGTRKWSVGPTAVVLRQEGPLTVGALANHLWSFAGDSERDSVNATYLQPFVSCGVWKGATLILNAEAAYDWHDGHWTAPFNLVLGQIVPIGGVPIQFQVGGRYYAKSPDGGPEWGLRFGITILLPQ